MALNAPAGSPLLPLKMVLIKIWVRKSQEVESWEESSQSTNNKPNSA
ncbi:622_t:CDS:2 [Funneliformis geosporum]|uniref:622_t:CDS:1 n=1 Tax=Funneliformis geosporum TaxID=1117311 RepID=A0A9W4SHS6_9GLOM|nr:622_t:CDS:2 [Funneliformis geosporum]